MSVKITDNTVTIIANNTRNASLALRFMADDVVRIAGPKTPRKRGNLSQDILRQVLGKRATIEWRKVYAQYQERGKRRDGSHVVRKYTRSGTGPHFAENAVKEVVANAEKYFKRARLI